MVSQSLANIDQGMANKLMSMGLVFGQCRDGIAALCYWVSMSQVLEPSFQFGGLERRTRVRRLRSDMYQVAGLLFVRLLIYNDFGLQFSRKL
jgi:hypothetical protein